MKKLLIIILAVLLGGTLFIILSGENKNFMTSVLNIGIKEDIIQPNTVKSSFAKGTISELSVFTGIIINKKRRDLAIISGSVIVNQYDCLTGSFSGTRLINVQYQVTNIGNISSSHYFASLTTPYINPYDIHGLGTPLLPGQIINRVHGLNLPGGNTSIVIKILPTNTTGLNNVRYYQIPGLTDRSLDLNQQNNIAVLKPVTITPCN